MKVLVLRTTSRFLFSSTIDSTPTSSEISKSPLPINRVPLALAAILLLAVQVRFALGSSSVDCLTATVQRDIYIANTSSTTSNAFTAQHIIGFNASDVIDAIQARNYTTEGENDTVGALCYTFYPEYLRSSGDRVSSSPLSDGTAIGIMSISGFYVDCAVGNLTFRSLLSPQLATRVVCGPESASVAPGAFPSGALQVIYRRRARQPQADELRSLMAMRISYKLLPTSMCSATASSLVQDFTSSVAGADTEETANEGNGIVARGVVTSDIDGAAPTVRYLNHESCTHRVECPFGSIIVLGDLRVNFFDINSGGMMNTSAETALCGDSLLVATETKGILSPRICDGATAVALKANFPLNARTMSVLFSSDSSGVGGG